MGQTVITVNACSTCPFIEQAFNSKTFGPKGPWTYSCGHEKFTHHRAIADPNYMPSDCPLREDSVLVVSHNPINEDGPAY